MDLLSLYIPMDRRQALARALATGGHSRGRMPIGSLPDLSTGAALFADISGFTTLAEMLVAKIDRRAPEELTRQLNMVYDALIAQVDTFGGSVIGFSGDAITCWFEGDSGMRATACALAMQEAMEQFTAIPIPTTVNEYVSLAMKVALATGSARRFVVGDPTMQLVDVLAGRTLDRMAQAEKLAVKGEIVMAPETAAALASELLVVGWREVSGERFAVVGGLRHAVEAAPWPPLPPEPLPAEVVRPWLIPTIYERLATAKDDFFLSDFRTAVALFLSFEGLDYDDDPESGGRLDAFTRWLQTILARYEGSLIQLTIGDKGSYFYVAFGAPLAHDDAPERAVATALELLSPPIDLNFISNIRIGISMGHMRTGAYGGTTRRTYGVLGDETNLAARLMQRAESGQILVTQRVAEAARDNYHFQTLAPIMVKGKREPIQVAVAVGRRIPAIQRPALLFPSALVGRDKELEQVSQRLELALSNRGQVLRIEGVAGVGKSHLAAEVTERARKLGFLLAMGVCQSINVGTPYAPWRQIMQPLLGISDESGNTESSEVATARIIAQVERFLQGINPSWLLRLPLLGDLLGLPIPDNATTAALDPKLRQDALFNLVVEIVQRLSHTQPLLILLEDIHWIDELSGRLTVALSRAIPSVAVMLVVVHRPSLKADTVILPPLSAIPHHTYLTLDELSPEGVRALVINRLRGEPTHLALSLIQAEAVGNPFFVEEVVDSLRESENLIQNPDGRWFLSNRVFDGLRQANCLMKDAEGHWILASKASLGAIDLGLPHSIQGVVLSRIDRLQEDQQMTLKVASVIGRTFMLEVLARSHPRLIDQVSLMEQIEVFELRDFARVEVPPPILVYMFKHNVTQEVAYGTLLFVQRQQLHRSVGQALEVVTPQATEELAHHFFLGESWMEAMRYQLTAGQAAQRLSATQEAIEHLRKALTSAEKLPPEETALERQTIHIALGELLANTDRYEAARDHLETGLRLAIERHDSDGQASACRWFARLYEKRSEPDQALDWIEQGLRALAERETVDAADLRQTAALIHTRMGNPAAALAECQQSLAIAERLGATAARGRAYSVMSQVPRLRGNRVLASEYSHQALALFKQAEDTFNQGRVHNQIATDHFYMGQWDEADYHYRQARAIFTGIGTPYNLIMVDNNLGGLARDQGRLDDARHFFLEGLNAAEQIGSSPYLLGALHMNLGGVFLRQGDIAQARNHLSTSLARFEQARSRDFLSEAHQLLASAALQAGDLPQAQAEADRALTLARELEMRTEEGKSLRVLGALAAIRGQLGEATQHLEASVAILDETGDQYECARSQLELASTYLAQGRTEEAQPLLGASEATFQRLGALLDQAAIQQARRRHSGTPSSTTPPTASP